MAALYANNVYDKHPEAKRDEAIRHVEESFGEATYWLREQADPTPGRDDDLDEDNPFFAKAMQGAEQMDRLRHDEGADEVSARDVVEGEQAAEQIRDAWADLDQS